MTAGVKLVVHSIDARVRPVRLRLPFRFGANTLTACPQLFIRAEVDVPGHGRAIGFAAELMVPKWFDKRAGHTPADNVAHLAQATSYAAAAYVANAPTTPFGLFARHCSSLTHDAAERGLTELSAAFGQAVIDRAVIDALCGALGVSFFEAARLNLFGLDNHAVMPDMAGWGWDAFLASLQPLRRIEARHTVGLLDELDTLHVGGDNDGGLPISLPAVIERYGHRSFKIKLGGDPAGDLARLRAVLTVLDARVGDYRYTLDGNEQYANTDALGALLAGLQDLRAPLYIEQPVPRELSFTTPLPASPFAFLMDEADGTLDAFPRGRIAGWTGVSSKGCKGVYKSLINRARCERWNREAGGARYFMSAEDLTCQAGLAVQQDLALVALLGITHSERNGHHYGRGLVDAPAAERTAFQRAHGDLYDDAGHLRIQQGALHIDSLFAPGYAASATLDWQATQPLANATELL